MDINTVRLKNVERIIDHQFGGFKSRFANGIGKNSVSVNRWWGKNPKNARRVSNKSAREIEEKLNLGKGWLDEQHNDHSDLETDPYKKLQIKLQSGKTYEVPIKNTATLDEQQLKLTLLDTVKGRLMLLSTDKNAWSIQLVGNHPQPMLSHGWGFAIEPGTPLTEQEYALLKINTGELLLRLITYIGADGSITAKNPITGQQESYQKEQIEESNYCYIGMPPSKFILESSTGDTK